MLKLRAHLQRAVRVQLRSQRLPAAQRTLRIGGGGGGNSASTQQRVGVVEPAHRSGSELTAMLRLMLKLLAAAESRGAAVESAVVSIIGAGSAAQRTR
jgi:hypothetical protein